MSDKTKAIENNTTENLQEKLKEASELFGFMRPDLKPADIDEEYGIFSSGDHASSKQRRVPHPSYRLQMQVAEVLIRAQEGCYPKIGKKALCSHNGIPEEEIATELSQRELDQKLLPLICRDLPEEWSIEDVSSAEVERMRIDFLSDT